MRNLLKLLLPSDSRRGNWARRIHRGLSAPLGSGPQTVRGQDLTQHELQELEASLRENYFNRQPSEYLTTERGRHDLADHLLNRMQIAREHVAPWLEAAKPLRGTRVLEIGCGTGSGVVALAERGAIVTGIDLDEGSLRVARKRCSLYRVDAALLAMSAADMTASLRDNPFDLIIFYASLEHMTHHERLQAIADTWEMLRPGDLWCLVETPNRLWHTDTHTSLLPFYNWLPDELAFKYARYSERTNFRECYYELTDERLLHFRRRGRGVSFHELDVALGSPDAYEVVSYMNEFLRRSGAYSSNTLSRSYLKVLRELAPGVHAAFLQEYLDIILRKPKGAADPPSP